MASTVQVTIAKGFRLRTVADDISSALNLVGIYCLLGMVLLTTIDVLGRYVFKRPIVGAYEITQFLMVIVVFFGFAYAQSRKNHVSVTLLVERFSEASRAVIDTVAYFLGFVMFLVIVWQNIIQSGVIRLSRETSALLEVPTWPFFWVIVLGSAVFCLVFLADIRDTLAVVAKGGLRAWAGLALGMLLVVAVSVIAIQGQQRFQLSPMATGLTALVMMIVFMMTGASIGVVMGITGFLGMIYFMGLSSGVTIMRTVPYAESSAYAMTVVPLFIIMGEFAVHSGLSRDLYWAGYQWLGRLPGGLAIASVAGCAGFSTVSGSGLATAVTIGTVALPEMKRYNYSDALATGCIASGGTLGILIPPSVNMMVYGMVTYQSIGRLFIGGIIPGILLALFYMVAVYIACKINPSLGPRGAPTSFKDKVNSLKGIWQVTLLFIVVIGGIYMGIFTPTEAAGIGAFGALVFALANRRLSWKNFRSSLLEAGKVNAMTIFILMGAVIFGYVLTVTRMPVEVANWIIQLNVNRYLVMAGIIVMYVILGCFMSPLSMIVITVPTFFPVVTGLGFDPIWYGILMVLMSEIGSITPPFGISVFVVQGISDVPLTTIFKGIVPFLLADLVLVALLVAFPRLVTFLPDLMKGA